MIQFAAFINVSIVVELKFCIKLTFKSISSKVIGQRKLWWGNTHTQITETTDETLDTSE